MGVRQNAEIFRITGNRFEEKRRPLLALAPVDLDQSTDFQIPVRSPDDFQLSHFSDPFDPIPQVLMHISSHCFQKFFTYDSALLFKTNKLICKCREHVLPEKLKLGQPVVRKESKDHRLGSCVGIRSDLLNAIFRRAEGASLDDQLEGLILDDLSLELFVPPAPLPA